MSDDRTELYAFLKESGFPAACDAADGHRKGRPAVAPNAVLLEPASSETKEVRRSEKTVIATISTCARDRHGDVVDPAGVRLDRFRKNPVVLYAHDYSGLPVAKSLWERVRVDDDGARLISKPQFHLNTELSREVWALVEKGVLSAWSIGFIPEKWRPGPGGRGFVVETWDLLEYSCVPVPANFEALTHELKARRITAPTLVKSFAPLGLEEPDLIAHDVRQAGERQATEDAEHTEVTAACAPQQLRQSRLPSVEEAVAKAFDRVLARSRGEGYV